VPLVPEAVQILEWTLENHYPTEGEYLFSGTNGRGAYFWMDEGTEAATRCDLCEHRFDADTVDTARDPQGSCHDGRRDPRHVR